MREREPEKGRRTWKKRSTFSLKRRLLKNYQLFVLRKKISGCEEEERGRKGEAKIYGWSPWPQPVRLRQRRVLAHVLRSSTFVARRRLTIPVFLREKRAFLMSSLFLCHVKHAEETFSQCFPPCQRVYGICSSRDNLANKESQLQAMGKCRAV